MVWKEKFRKTSGTMEESCLLISIIDLNSPNTGNDDDDDVDGDGCDDHDDASLKAGNNG
jgi:hypothetical protein